MTIVKLRWPGNDGPYKTIVIVGQQVRPDVTKADVAATCKGIYDVANIRLMRIVIADGNFYVALTFHSKGRKLCLGTANRMKWMALLHSTGGHVFANSIPKHESSGILNGDWHFVTQFLDNIAKENTKIVHDGAGHWHLEYHLPSYRIPVGECNGSFFDKMKHEILPLLDAKRHGHIHPMCTMEEFKAGKRYHDFYGCGKNGRRVKIRREFPNGHARAIPEVEDTAADEPSSSADPQSEA